MDTNIIWTLNRRKKELAVKLFFKELQKGCFIFNSSFLYVHRDFALSYISLLYYISTAYFHKTRCRSEIFNQSYIRVPRCDIRETYTVHIIS